MDSARRKRVTSMGDFLVAAELGRTLASTDRDTLAARATVVEAAFRAQKDDKSRCSSLPWPTAPRARAIRSIWMRTSSSPWRSATWVSSTARSRRICRGMRAKVGATSIARWSWTRTTPGRTARWGCGTSRSCSTQALRSAANSTVRRPKTASRTASVRSSWRPRASGCALAARLAAGGRSRRLRPTGGRTPAYRAAPAAARLVQRQAQRLLGEAGGSSGGRSGRASRRPDLVEPPKSKVARSPARAAVCLWAARA